MSEPAVARPKAPLVITYAREDKEFAMRLAKSLRAASAPVWIDQLDIRAGERWDHAVETALKQCAGLILILSPASVASENVMDEVSYALEAGKQVVPLVHLPCDIPFRLRRVQYIDFTGDYDSSLVDLLAALGGSVSTSSESTKVPTDERPPSRPKPSEERADRTSAGKPLSGARRVTGAFGGGLVGAYVGSVMTELFRTPSIRWEAFDYGNPIAFTAIGVGIAGAIAGTDIRAILYGMLGIFAGFLVFTFLNSSLFMVEEGIALLPLGAVTGAMLARAKVSFGSDSRGRRAAGQ